MRGSAASARMPSRSAPSAKILTSGRQPPRRSLTPSPRRGSGSPRRGAGRRRRASGAAAASRLWALPGCSTRTVAAPGRARRPRRRRRCRRPSRALRGRGRAPRAASSSMPGAGLRQSQRPASSATTPSGWCRQKCERRRASHPPPPASSMHARLNRVELPRGVACPWPPPAGSRHRRARSPRLAQPSQRARPRRRAG